MPDGQHSDGLPLNLKNHPMGELAANAVVHLSQLFFGFDAFTMDFVTSSLRSANSHLKCKAGPLEGFDRSEIVESLSRSIVKSLGDVCKGVV